MARAVLHLESGAAVVQRIECRFHGAAILGMHAVQPVIQRVADLVRRIAERGLPARRVEDDAAHDVPVPQPVARPPGREGEALTTLDEPLLYAHARAEAGER